MKNALTIHMEMPPRLADALQRELRERLRLALQELWYADEFRFIPDGFRAGAILTAYPALAAQKKTLGALQAAIKEQA